jgi:hypothetical protein
LWKFEKNFVLFFKAYFWPAAALQAGGGGPEEGDEKKNEIVSILPNYLE